MIQNFIAATIGDLIFHLVIREIVKTLQNQELEHHQPVKRWSADIVAVFGFIEDHVKNRGENLPVDILLKLDQRILDLCQALKQKMFVKKAKRADVFHDSNDNMR